MSRKANVEPFIHIQTRENGKQYGKYCPSDRKHGGKDVYLGRVVNDKEGIFYNRNQGGYFQFTVDAGRKELKPEQKDYLHLVDKGEQDTTHRRHVSISFGDVWMFDQMLIISGLKNLYSKVLPDNSDTLLALVAFKLLGMESNLYAKRWWECSYAQYLYPHAKIESQRISEFLELLGQEETKHDFFDLYIPFLQQLPGMSENILIDSTGLGNKCHIDCSARNNHNGVISREARLIYVVDRESGMPVFFRYVAGNIVDVSTLKVTVNIMKAQGVEIRHSILDAGYISFKNLRFLLDNHMPFLTRMPDKMAKKLIKENGDDLYSMKNSLLYGDRLICMKRVPFIIDDYECSAYIAIDVDRQKDEQIKFMKKGLEDTKTERNDEQLKALGYFVMLSSEKMETKEILPLYYMRQTIEQTFDFAKNDVDLLPIRANKIETFCGHLLLCFMTTVALVSWRRLLKTRPKLQTLCPIVELRGMSYIRAESYNGILVPTEPNKYNHLVLDQLKLTIPEEVVL